MQQVARNTRGVAAAACALACTINCDAQSAAPSTQSLPVINVSASADDMREVAVTAKIVVTRQELDRYGDGNVTDVLARQPGVSVETSKGREPEIKVRGLGSGRTILLIDGTPAPPGISIETLSPAQIERIEIVRGSSADVSSQGVAGSVNFVLRKSVERSGTVKLIAASTAAGASPRFEVTTVAKTDSTRVSLSAAATSERSRSVYETDEKYLTHSTGSYDRRFTEVDGYRRAGIDASVTSEIRLKAAESLKVEALLRARRSSATYDEAAHPLTGPLPRYAQSRLVIRQSVASASMKAAWDKKLHGGGTAELSLSYSSARTPSNSELSAWSYASALALERAVEASPTDRQAVFSSRVSLPVSDAYTVRFGASSVVKARSEFRARREQMFSLPATTLDEQFQATTVNPAAFIQGEINVEEALSADIGLRWEALQTRIVASGIDPVGQSFGILSPSINVVWKPSAMRQQYRFGISRTYRPPTPSELTPRRFIDTTNSPVSPDSIGNPHLVPESAWGLDVAYERYWDEGDMFSLGAYAKQIRNVIATRLMHSMGRWTTQPDNLGTASAHGLEVEIRRHMRHLDPVLSPYEIRASAGWHSSRIHGLAAPDNRLDRQDRFIGTLTGNYRSASYPLTLSVSVSASTGSWVDRGSGLREHMPSKKTVAMTGHWRLASGTILRASLLNAARPSIYTEKAFRMDGAELVRTLRETTSRTFRVALEVPL